LDPLALLSVAVLVVLGLGNLQALGGRSLAVHQAAAVAAGLVGFVLVGRASSRNLRILAWSAYGLSLLLLVTVLAAPAVAGARRWLSLGAFTLQPSELAKVGLLLALADVLGSERSWLRRFTLAMLTAAVPIGLVVIEPDLSTATVLSTMTLIMLVLGGIPLRMITALVLGAAALVPVGLRFLHPYQLERLHAFLGSGSSTGAGWSVLQAHIALAWGGLSGQSRQPGHLLLAQYLPERESDLAFASLVEEGGILAGLLAVLAVSVLVWRLAAASRHARTRPAALFAAGFAALLGTEVAISVAANLGLIPTAGVPFPLLSYGGTAAVAHIVAIGAILGLRADADAHPLWLRPPWRRVHPRWGRATAAALSLALIGMLGFAWHLQRTRGPELRTAGLTQMTRCITVPAPRGVIADRHNTPLATNVPRDQVWVTPALLPASDIPALAALTSRPITVLRRMLSVPSYTLSVTVASLPTAAGARVEQAHLPGVLVEPQPRRDYPYGTLLGPVLGWTGIVTAADLKQRPALGLTATVGRAGIEQQYDSTLRGVDGQQCFYVDPTGTPVSFGTHRAPVQGAALRLTLDLGMQQTLTRELANSLRGINGAPAGDQGAAVALDPGNGEVLAMASLPSYDDNLYTPPMNTAALNRMAKVPGNAQLEHVTQSVAPPGSTFKLVVASADLIHHTVPPDEIVPTGGSWTLDGHTFHNWESLPPQDLPQAIAWSNDVYFYKLANSLGAPAIISAARRLGVGQPTGIDLPGEYAGYLGTPQSVKKIGATWYSGSTVLLGIGQGYLAVTPLQDAMWTSAVATGATVTPHLGLATAAPDGTPIALTWPAPNKLAFAGELGPLRDGMRQVVTNGTGRILATLPAPAAGKTGTAEDATAPGGAEDHWMSAVVPAQKPAVEVTSFIHGGGNGSITAGNVVVSGMAYFLSHRSAILANQ
jgi:cell division protein FtsI/penicillin-binding protein 2/cell division protein FtsW (lipid II flippase)